MERRLFEELVSSPDGGEGRRNRLLPLSLAIHATALAVVLAVPVLTPEELPQVEGAGGDNLTVPTVLVPPAPPPRGIPTRALARRSAPAPARDPSFVDPVIALPTSWSNLPAGGDDLGDLGDLPVCQGCVPWGDVDGVPAPGAPPPVPPPAPVVRPGGAIEPPLKVRDRSPQYPKLARDAGVEGLVIIECRIDTTGDVVDAHVLRGHPLLNAAALEAVRQWRYRPTLLNGQRVSVLMTVTVRFQLRRS